MRRQRPATCKSGAVISLLHRCFDRRSHMKAVSQPPNGYPDGLDTFWAQSPGAICAKLHCRSEGLSSDDAQRRLIQYGPKSDAETSSDSVVRAILRRLL